MRITENECNACRAYGPVVHVTDVSQDYDFKHDCSRSTRVYLCRDCLSAAVALFPKGTEHVKTQVAESGAEALYLLGAYDNCAVGAIKLLRDLCALSLIECRDTLIRSKAVPQIILSSRPAPGSHQERLVDSLGTVARLEWRQV